MQEYKLYIDGEFCDSRSGKTLESTNPATEAPWARVARADREDTRRAIQAARKAFDEGPWPRMQPGGPRRDPQPDRRPASRRGRRRSPSSRRTTAAAPSARPCGDMMLGVAQLRYFAEMAEKLPLLKEIEVPQFPAQSKNYLQREPFGVCGQIIPWNFPLMMAVWKIGPALATGNTVVIKPATDTPCSLFELASIIDKTDLPKGVVNVIHGARRRLRRGDLREPAGRQGRVHRLDRRRPAHHAARLRHREEGHARARRQVGQHHPRRRRPRDGRSTARSSAASSTRARPASRARGSSSPRRSTTRSSRSSSSARSSSTAAIRSTW